MVLGDAANEAMTGAEAGGAGGSLVPPPQAVTRREAAERSARVRVRAMVRESYDRSARPAMWVFRPPAPHVPYPLNR
jgi:hypothetical protein